MNLQKHLQAAGVPEALHAQAIACLREADKLSDGLTLSVLPGRGD